jgi:predicted CopG family antitoxin
MVDDETKIPVGIQMNQFERAKALPQRTITIKVGVRTWDALKSLKSPNETFDDVINTLLMKRTQIVGNDNLKAIKYHRKTAFFTLRANDAVDETGFEVEYNDINNQQDFVLDLKVKKVFFNRKIYNPSEFFGVDNEHKHFSLLFLGAYLLLVDYVLKKEFGFTLKEMNSLSIVAWRTSYSEYNLSEESFKSDIEEPMRLSEDEKPSKKWMKRINNSIFVKFYASKNSAPREA